MTTLTFFRNFYHEYIMNTTNFAQFAPIPLATMELEQPINTTVTNNTSQVSVAFVRPTPQRPSSLRKNPENSAPACSSVASNSFASLCPYLSSHSLSSHSASAFISVPSSLLQQPVAMEDETLTFRQSCNSAQSCSLSYSLPGIADMYALTKSSVENVALSPVTPQSNSRLPSNTSFPTLSSSVIPDEFQPLAQQPHNAVHSSRSLSLSNRARRRCESETTQAPKRYCQE